MWQHSRFCRQRVDLHPVWFMPGKRHRCVLKLVLHQSSGVGFAPDMDRFSHLLLRSTAGAVRNHHQDFIVCRNALAQAQQAAAHAIASKGKDGSVAGDDKKSPVKQEPGADTEDGVKAPQALHCPKPAGSALVCLPALQSNAFWGHPCTVPKLPKTHARLLLTQNNKMPALMNA